MWRKYEFSGVMGMSDTTKESREQRSLKQEIINTKNRLADERDVVVDMKEAELARVELLAADLAPLLDEIDEADERFDFGISRGKSPRLWIDMTAFIAMGHDKRSYRFLKDTRMGRIVLAETGDREKMADIVSQYVAEKVIERERMIEGEWQSVKELATLSEDAIGEGDMEPDAEGDLDEEVAFETASAGRKSSRWGSFGWFVFGVLCCAAALLAAAFVLSTSAL